MGGGGIKIEICSPRTPMSKQKCVNHNRIMIIKVIELPILVEKIILLQRLDRLMTLEEVE